MEYLIDNSEHQKPKKSNPIFSLIKVLFVICLITIGFAVNGYISFKSKILAEKTTLIEINSGETYTHLSETLNSYGIKINGDDIFYYKAYIKSHSTLLPKLQVGEYSIPKGAKIKEVINSLKYPINDQVKLTILEGWNIYDIDAYLSDSSRELIKGGEFIKVATNYPRDYIVTYPFLTNQKTLEGYLYPDTYFVKEADFKPEDLIKKMLDNFNSKVYKPHLKGISTHEIYKILKLASIVELEEKVDKNKSIIAAIFQNRIIANDFIGADITACYAYKKTLEECDENFINRNIYDKNDYNTRVTKGLTPTPIGNPDLTSILSSISPEKTDYYYYIHDKKGNIRLAKTTKEHNLNIQKYLR